MEADVIQEISSFLDAYHYQVAEWDGEVVKGIAENPLLLHEFKTADDLGKWDIYNSFRRN